MRTSFHHQSEAQPPNGPLTVATSPDTPSTCPATQSGLHQPLADDRRCYRRKGKKSPRTLRKTVGLSLRLLDPGRRAIARGGGKFDVLADGAVVGRIFKANAAAVGSPSMWTLAFGKWTLAFGNHDRTPIHGYEATHEAEMVAFAKSW